MSIRALIDASETSKLESGIPVRESPASSRKERRVSLHLRHPAPPGSTPVITVPEHYKSVHTAFRTARSPYSFGCIVKKASFVRASGHQHDSGLENDALGCGDDWQ